MSEKNHRKRDAKTRLAFILKGTSRGGRHADRIGGSIRAATKPEGWERRISSECLERRRSRGSGDTKNGSAKVVFTRQANETMRAGLELFGFRRRD